MTRASRLCENIAGMPHNLLSLCYTAGNMKKSSQNKATATKLNWFQIHKKFTITLCVFVWLYFMSLFVPIIGAFTQFPLHVVRCGHLPIIVDFKNGYKLPEDWGYGVGLYTKKFVCTEAEVRQEGLSH